jgi:hypothetical protein
VNRKNLIKLRDYLRGPLKARFGMSSFGNDEGPTCGTVGCALGHATYCVAPKGINEDWDDYGNRLFDLLGDDEWEWLFDADWCEVDNTPEGAAVRIDILLESGVPDDMQDQLYGHAPLCYKVP